MGRITVEESVKANIDKVWEYWTNPLHISRWNFATEDWCCPKVINNLKPNEQFSWRMEAKDGSMGFDFTGTYDKVLEKKLISYKISDGRRVQITFVQNGNEVKVSETFEAEETNTNDKQRAGWQTILKIFKKYVEST